MEDRQAEGTVPFSSGTVPRKKMTGDKRLSSSGYALTVQTTAAATRAVARGFLDVCRLTASGEVHAALWRRREIGG